MPNGKPHHRAERGFVWTSGEKYNTLSLLRRAALESTAALPHSIAHHRPLPPASTSPELFLSPLMLRLIPLCATPIMSPTVLAINIAGRISYATPSAGIGLIKPRPNTPTSRARPPAAWAEVFLDELQLVGLAFAPGVANQRAPRVDQRRELAAQSPRTRRRTSPGLSAPAPPGGPTPGPRPPPSAPRRPGRGRSIPPSRSGRRRCPGPRTAVRALPSPSRRQLHHGRPVGFEEDARDGHLDAVGQDLSVAGRLPEHPEAIADVDVLAHVRATVERPPRIAPASNCKGSTWPGTEASSTSSCRTSIFASLSRMDSTRC